MLKVLYTHRTQGKGAEGAHVAGMVEAFRLRGHQVVVDCLPETQVERVMARSGLGEAQVRAIIAAQAPREARLAAADTVIFNQDLSLEQLEAEVRRVAAGFGL